MSTFTHKPGTPQQHSSAKPGRIHFGHSHEVNSLLPLQHTLSDPAKQLLPEANAVNDNGDSNTSDATRLGHDFSRVAVFSPASADIQPKMHVHPLGGRFGHEVNQAADQMMPMPEPPLQRQAIPPLLPEQERLEAEEEEEERLEAKPLDGRTTQVVQRQAMLKEGNAEEPLQDTIAISRIPIQHLDDGSTTADVIGMPGGLKAELEGL